MGFAVLGLRLVQPDNFKRPPKVKSNAFDFNSRNSIKPLLS